MRRPGSTKRILQVSVTFSYEQDPAGTTCASRIGRMFIDGVEIAPTDSFRVTMNNFLATGGDGFTVFNERARAPGRSPDIDALVGVRRRRARRHRGPAAHAHRPDPSAYSLTLACTGECPAS